MFDLAYKIGRPASEVAHALLREHLKVVSDLGLLDELIDRCELEDRPMCYFVREAVRAGLARYSAQPWAIPFSPTPASTKSDPGPVSLPTNASE